MLFLPSRLPFDPIFSPENLTDPFDLPPPSAPFPFVQKEGIKAHIDFCGARTPTPLYIRTRDLRSYSALTLAVTTADWDRLSIFIVAPPSLASWSPEVVSWVPVCNN